MLPPEQPDRIQIVFDDHRLVPSPLDDDTFDS